MKKDISIIGVPMDLGQTRRGVDMGPSAIRYAGVVERLENLTKTIEDLGDIEIGSRERTATGESNLKNLKAVAEATKNPATKVH